MGGGSIKLTRKGEQLKSEVNKRLEVFSSKNQALTYLQLLYDSSLLFVIYNSTKIQVTKRKNGTYYIHTSDFIISDPVH